MRKDRKPTSSASLDADPATSFKTPVFALKPVTNANQNTGMSILLVSAGGPMLLASVDVERECGTQPHEAGDKGQF